VLLASPGQDPPQFRSAANFVRLEVSALDAAGKPVRGLPASAFSVTDDGRPQTIAAFAEVDVPAPPPASAASWVRDGVTDVESNASGPAGAASAGRLLVLLLDDLLLPADAAVLDSARQIGRMIVERLSPADRMAVVFTSGGSRAQNFTGDRRKLLAAIASLQAGSAAHTLGWETAVPRNPIDPRRGLVPATDPDMPLRLASLKTLQMVAETVIAVPERRRAVFFVSPGIAVDSGSEAQPVAIGGTAPGLLAIREANRQLVRDSRELWRRMGAANVTAYAIDPCGLGGFESYVSDAARRLSSLRSADAQPLPPFYNWMSPESPPPPSDLARHVTKLNHDFLHTAASQTGGRAIVNTNGFTAGLDTIFGENTAYYLLAYPEPKGRAPGTIHRIAIKVDRPGVTVRHRTSYVSRAAAAAPPPTADEAIARALSEPLSSTTLPMDVSFAPLAGATRTDATITIVLGLHQPPVVERTRQVIDFATAVFTPDGRPIVSPVRQTLAFTIVPSGGDLFRYEVLTKVDVPPGRYEIRIAAHRASDGLTGSVMADLEVPQFRESPLSLSGVWLEVSPRPAALPSNAFATLLPVVPSARRDFAPTDTATALLRVYQGGAGAPDPATVVARITDERGAVLATTTDTIEAARFDATSRVADYPYRLPLDRLPASRYLLSFEVAQGSAQSRRDVIFNVR
jgi:VWFA-related protein